MAKIIESGQAGQLDFFGPERLGLEAHIGGVLEEPTPQNLDRVRHDVAVLRSSPVVERETVESVTNLVRYLPDRAYVDDLPDEQMADVVAVAVEAAGVVSRFSGWSKGDKGALYVNSLGLLGWMEDHPGAVTPEQLAVSAASVGVMYGHPQDLSRAYEHIDVYAAERRSHLSADWVGSVDQRAVPLRRALVDLSAVDKTVQPVSRMHQAHLDQAEIVADNLGVEPPRAESTLDLVRILCLIEKNRGLARRVIHHARGAGIEFNPDVVQKTILARHGGRTEKSLLRFVTRELTEAA